MQPLPCWRGNQQGGCRYLVVTAAAFSNTGDTMGMQAILEAEQAVPTIENEEQGSRRMDLELRTIGAMLRMLDDMDDSARARVVTYLSSRFQSGGK